MAPIEYERLANKIDLLEDLLKKEGPSPGFFRGAESIDNEIMIARRLSSTPREEEAFMLLQERLGRMMSRFSTK